MSSRRFVLLDRDGTLIVEKHYLSDPDQVELIAGAAEGLRRLAARGLGLVLVTNQSGIGRGFFDAARLAEIHERLLRELRAEVASSTASSCVPTIRTSAAPAASRARAWSCARPRSSASSRPARS